MDYVKKDQRHNKSFTGVQKDKTREEYMKNEVNRRYLNENTKSYIDSIPS